MGQERDEKVGKLRAEIKDLATELTDKSDIGIDRVTAIVKLRELHHPDIDGLIASSSGKSTKRSKSDL